MSEIIQNDECLPKEETYKRFLNVEIKKLEEKINALENKVLDLENEHIKEREKMKKVKTFYYGITSLTLVIALCALVLGTIVSCDSKTKSEKEIADMIMDALGSSSDAPKNYTLEDGYTLDLLSDYERIDSEVNIKVQDGLLTITGLTGRPINLSDTSNTWENDSVRLEAIFNIDEIILYYNDSPIRFVKRT